MMRATGVTLVISLNVLASAAQAAEANVQAVRLGPSQTAGTWTRISEHGLNLVYLVRKGAKQLLVVDGNAGPEFDQIATPTFSPDGRRVAYAANNGEKAVVVIDGKPRPEFDNVADAIPVFSPDARRVAYGIRSGKNFLMVIDGQHGQLIFDGIGAPVFSPDSKRVAYVALRDDKPLVVVDGLAGPEFDAMLKPPVFSMDSKQSLTQPAKAKNGWRLSTGASGPSSMRL